VTQAPRLLAKGLQFPEAPIFDTNGQLWCAELENGCITRIGENGRLDRYEVGGRPSGIALGCDGYFWYCDAHRNQIRVFCSKSGDSWAAAGSADGRDLDAPNDLAFDSFGNLVFSCHNQARELATGYIAVLRPSGECSIAATSLQFPNGIAFGLDGKVLFVAETYKQRVLRGQWHDVTGCWRLSGEVMQTPGPNGPDGLALDTLGNVYTAVYGAGCIMATTPDGVTKIPVDGRCPTNCAFDPAGELGLVFTEAETGTVASIFQTTRGLPLHLARKNFWGRHAAT